MGAFKEKVHKWEEAGVAVDLQWLVHLELASERLERVSLQLSRGGHQVSRGNKVTADWINLRTQVLREARPERAICFPGSYALTAK